MLDRLIEHATATDPTVRPTMIDFAQELRSWLEPMPSQFVLTNLSNVISQLQATTTPATRENEARNQRYEQARQILRSFNTYVRPSLLSFGQQGLAINCTLDLTSSSDPNLNMRVGSRVFMESGADIHMLGKRDKQLDSSEYFHYEVAPQNNRTHLVRSAIACYVTKDGYANLLASHYVHAAGDNDHFWCDHRLFPLASAQESHAIAELANIFLKEWPLALARLSQLASLPMQGRQMPHTIPIQASATRNIAAQLKRVQARLVQSEDTLRQDMHSLLVPALTTFAEELRARNLSASFEFTNSIVHTRPSARRDCAILILSTGAVIHQADLHRSAKTNQMEQIRLDSGIGLEVYDDGSVYLASAHILLSPLTETTVFWIDTRTVLEEEAELRIAFAELATGLLSSFLSAYNEYDALINSYVQRLSA